MTTIYCTNKLKDFIGSTRLIPVDSSVQSPFGDWNGHVFLYDRHKHLIFVNNKSFYSIIIEDIKKADLKNIETIFLNRLIEQLVFDKVINHSDTLVVLQRFLPVRLTNTNNDKKTIGALNDFVYQYQCNCDSPYWIDKPIIKINNSINNGLTGAGRNQYRKYSTPSVDMKEMINTSP